MPRRLCSSFVCFIFRSLILFAPAALILFPPTGLADANMTVPFDYFVGDPDPSPFTVVISSPYGPAAFTAVSNSPWLAVSPNFAYTPAELTLNVHPADLAPGTYNGAVVISQFGVATNYVYVTLAVKVFQPVDRLILSPGSLTFRATDGKQPTMMQAFKVNSSGQDFPYLVSVSGGAGWLTADGTAGPPPGWHFGTPATIRVFANPQGLPPGTYTGSVVISASRAVNNPQAVAVTLIVGPPPSLQCSTSSLAFQYQLGDSQSPAPQTIAVSSTSTALSFSVSAVTPGGNWLWFSPGYGTTPSTISATLNTADLPPGNYTGTIVVEEWTPGTSTCKIPVNVTLAPDIRPRIKSDGVVNGGSFTQGFSPGSWITIFGENLSTIGPQGRPWRGDEIVGGKLPISLEGTRVLINDKPAAIAYVSAEQLNLQAPDDEARGTVKVTVTAPSGTTEATGLLQTFSPALFADGKTANGGYVAGIHADGSLLGAGNNQTSPARPGEVVMLYGTGFGPTTPSRPAGEVIDPAHLTSSFTVTIGGVPAEVIFGGIVGPGLYQINVRVPVLPAGDHDVAVSIGGLRTQDGVLIPISQ